MQEIVTKAKEAHLNWLAQAKTIVDKGSIKDVNTPVGDEECQFGKVLHSGLLSAMDEETMEVMDTSHFMLHDMYKNIFDLFEGSDTLDAESKVKAAEYYELLEEISEVLMEELDNL